MKTIVPILFAFLCCIANAQSIVGSWQLVNQSHCMEDEIAVHDSDVEITDMQKDLKTRGQITRQVVEFRDNNTGAETTKSLSQKKSYNPRSFMYKLTDNTLYLLDKKTRTIIEGFTVERFTADSLVLSDAQRACETKVFVKIR